MTIEALPKKKRYNQIEKSLFSKYPLLATYLSWYKNLMKSALGGFGITLKQLPRESS